MRFDSLLRSGVLFLTLALPAAPAGAAAKGNAAVRSRPPTPPRLTALAILPAPVRLDGPLDSQRLLVMGTLADGSRRDLTAASRLYSSAPSVAGLEGTRLRARGDGTAALTARYGTLTARAAVTVRNTGRPVSYSFRHDVVPVLARLGCSAGTCHGANSGKGGFRLSLRGYAPEQDFLAITRELGGRRLSREAPAESLLLRKPTMRAPHGGGRALVPDTPEYFTLLGWILQGAPGPDEREPDLVSLTALPGERRFGKGERQGVLVRAVFSDGSARDVTDRALYRSNDAGVAAVSAAGLVTAVGPGSSAVQAKYLDRLAVVRVTVPFPRPPRPAAFPPPAGYVDEAVHAKLRELNLQPSPACSDEEFLRRAYLDVLGTLPTAEEARAFLEDRAPGKRERLIEAVLRRPEYGSVWALKLCDLSMVRREHMQRKNTVALHQWFTEQFRENRPWDRLVADLVTASGSIEERPQTLWWASRQRTRPNARGWVRHYELTGEIVAQVFLGQRIQCARCHNHPTEQYTQEDYYRFAAIFAQVNGEGRADPVPERFHASDPGEVLHPRTGRPVTAAPLDRSHLAEGMGEDRRVRFAAWLAGAGRESFSRNIANRVWARLFGTGIVDPVDDLRSTNPARNELLLGALARDLVSHGYDLKYLMGAIMRSRTYQASSVPAPGSEGGAPYFAHYPVRRMQGEELLDAIAQVTGVPERFGSYPLGTRAVELSDPELSSPVLDTFGRPPRVTPCDCDRSDAPSISQALELFNGEGLQARLKDPDGTVARLLRSGESDDAVIEELFLRALSRRPTPRERAATRRLVAAAPGREEGMQDLLWALINSKEFLFHH